MILKNGGFLMKRIVVICCFGLFLFSACASSKGGASGTSSNAASDKALLEETRISSEKAVDKVHELELEKVKLESMKSSTKAE